MLKAIELLGCSSEETISFGDRAIDILSSNRAGIKSVACYWGTKEAGVLTNSGFNLKIHKPIEIIPLLVEN